MTCGKQNIWSGRIHTAKMLHPFCAISQWCSSSRGCRWRSESDCWHDEIDWKFWLWYFDHGQREKSRYSICGRKRSSLNENQWPLLQEISSHPKRNLWEGNEQVQDLFFLPLGYHILQLSKLHMLHFLYNCLAYYCDVKDFEYLELDTDSAYTSMAAKSLDEMVLPAKKQNLQFQKMGQCRDFALN